MSRSLRARLLLGTSSATAVILGLLGICLFVAMRRSLLLDFDSALFTKSTALAAMAEQDGHVVRFETDYLAMEEFTKSPTPDFFEAFLNDGKSLAASPSLGERTLVADPASATPIYRNLTLPNGRSGRAITLAFVPRYEAGPGDAAALDPNKLQHAVIILARDTTQFDATLNHLRWLLTASFGMAIFISGLVLVAIVNRAMKPVRLLAARLESFGATELASRLEAGGVPLELTPVVERLNDLLARLQQAFVREKLFTADVAHELRTPLSALQTTLQVCRTRQRAPAEYEATADKCLKVVVGMHAIIESLLLLARADAGQLPVVRQPVDIPCIVGECWATFQPRADAYGLRVSMHLPEAGEIESDPEKLRIVLNNLLENAVCHCDENGAIGIEAAVGTDGLTVRITNSAKEFRDENLQRLFDRFWQADNARAQTGAHCGLGLSICYRLANLLGGRLEPAFRDNQFCINLLLPTQSPKRIADRV